MPRSPTRTDERAAGGGIQVISRAGAILRSLSNEPDGLNLSDIAERVELPRSTVHRIINALQVEGLITQAGPNARYRLTPELMRLVHDRHAELHRRARPELEKLFQRIDETVDLAILTHDKVTFIDQIVAPHPLRAVSARGAILPAYCTAPGRALLATLSDGVIVKLVPARLRRFTDATVTTRDELLRALAEVRETGVAIVHDEYTAGISAVSAVIRDASGGTAAVSIPVPTQRFAGQERVLIRALRETCQAITADLGSG